MDEIDEILESNVEELDIAKRNDMARGREVENLIENIKAAAHINENKRALFLRLAEVYLKDMEDNIFLNQFKLAGKYGDTTADEWTSFLADNMVAKYIGRHKNMFLRSSAESNLVDPYAKGKKDSLSLIEKIEDKTKEDSKQNIIIMRIPNVHNKME